MKLSYGYGSSNYRDSQVSDRVGHLWDYRSLKEDSSDEHLEYKELVQDYDSLEHESYKQKDSEGEEQGYDYKISAFQVHLYARPLDEHIPKRMLKPLIRKVMGEDSCMRNNSDCMKSTSIRCQNWSMMPLHSKSFGLARRKIPIGKITLMDMWYTLLWMLLVLAVWSPAQREQSVVSGA